MAFFAGFILGVISAWLVIGLVYATQFEEERDK